MRSVALIMGVLCGLTACGENSAPVLPPDAAPPPPAPDAMVAPPPDVDRSDELFKADEVLSIVVDMASADFEALRFEARNGYDERAGADCQAAPAVSPYNYYPASVTINGERIDNIGVRKKGWFGSVNPFTPSLKLNLDYYVQGQEHLSVEDITLNNGTQFGSRYLLLTQCLGYQLFASAGIPASRCNYAHVTVNDEEMGIYVHVERVRRPMLERHFEDGDGLVWEGTRSDFRDGWLGTFDQKTNESTVLTREPLEHLADVLLLPTSVFSQIIGEVIDFDQFLRFWAMEVLVSHIDGYAGNTNNFFVYDDPTSGLLHFLPWGIDALFFEPSNPDQRVMKANSSLTRRLYLMPLMRARFLATMAELLETVWSEDDIIAEIDRMDALLSPYIVDDPATLANEPQLFADQSERIRTYVENRRAFVEPLLTASPELTGELADDKCVEPNGTFTATFSTTWQAWDADALANGSTASPAVELNGTTFTIVDGGAVAGDSDDATYSVGLKVVALRSPQNTAFPVTITIKPTAAQVGVDIPVDWQGARAVYGAGFFGGGLADGTVHFDTLDMSPGGVVSGSVALTLYQ